MKIMITSILYCIKGFNGTGNFHPSNQEIAGRISKLLNKQGFKISGVDACNVSALTSFITGNDIICVCRDSAGNNHIIT